MTSFIDYMTRFVRSVQNESLAYYPAAQDHQFNKPPLAELSTLSYLAEKQAETQDVFVRTDKQRLGAYGTSVSP